MADSSNKYQENQAQIYLDLAGVMFIALNKDQTVRLANKKACQVLGYDKEEIIGRNWFNHFLPERLRDEVRGVFTHLIAGNVEPVEYFENPVLTRQGKERIIAWHNTVLRDQSGQIYGTLASGEDITERKQVEEKFEKAFNNSLDAMIISLVETGQMIEVNEGLLKLTGYTAEEVIGKTSTELKMWPTVDDRKRAIEILERDGCVRNLDIIIAHKSGELRDCLFSAELINLHGQRCMLSICHDITERKQAEEELHKAFNEIKKLKDRIEAENILLRKEIHMAHLQSNIVGQSKSMKLVLAQAEQVAGTDANVLILGETGTGKELLARAIHKMSRRKEHSLVVVNCAAIPSNLVESELFGREKGAYTGATTMQIGRFEVANGTTIFLDEIGELSPENQAKLLRVLQEGEIQRLGSTQVIPVDVRVIAATNRDLGKEVAKGRFREDLYYRLNVFPIELPPLRERLDDIEDLVWGFIEEFSEKMGKTIESIPKKNMEGLKKYSWPGNIRELKNLVERSMILCQGSRLKIEVPYRHLASEADSVLKTITMVEKQHIHKVLRSTGWRIRGQNGAAEILGLKPTTLEARMSKLGIQRPTKYIQ
jgi:PAS domain S-box-containing protein